MCRDRPQINRIGYRRILAIGSSLLDTHAIRMCEINHTCDLQHLCRFAHKKDCIIIIVCCVHHANGLFLSCQNTAEVLSFLYNCIMMARVPYTSQYTATDMHLHA